MYRLADTICSLPVKKAGSALFVQLSKAVVVRKAACWLSQQNRIGILPLQQVVKNCFQNQSCLVRGLPVQYLLACILLEMTSYFCLNKLVTNSSHLEKYKILGINQTGYYYLCYSKGMCNRQTTQSQQVSPTCCQVFSGNGEICSSGLFSLDFLQFMPLHLSYLSLLLNFSRNFLELR